VRPETAVASVELLHRLLAVHVVHPVGEVEQERGGVEVLPDEVRRVEVEPERRPVLEQVQRATSGPVVVGDLGRVDLEREADPHLLEDVEDR
jgi:hypothetical protein